MKMSEKNDNPVFIKLDILSNSVDYLKHSLECYYIADENGEYGDFATFDKKVKWKMAWISLSQAIEILLKYGLYCINAGLIYDNIDASKFGEDIKTVDASKSMIRLKNLGNLPLSQEEIEYVDRGFKTRNRFIHYKVEMECDKVKESYAKLFSIYKKLYEKYTGKKNVEYGETKDLYNKLDTELSNFAENLVIFRGFEIYKSELERLKKEIEFNQKNCFVVDNNGNRFQRIKYYSNMLDDNRLYRYCGDCCAVDGEYHLFGCDIERCPQCGNQLLSCDCQMKLEVEGKCLDLAEYYATR